MTDPVHDVAMGSGADPDPAESDDRGPTGIMVLTAWTEPTAAGPELRVRIKSHSDVDDEPNESAAPTIDAALDATRIWLEAILRSATT